MINDQANKAVTPIRDPAIVGHVRMLAKPIVESPAIIRANWLLQNQWLAIPFSSGDDPADIEEHLLPGTIARLGHRNCYGIWTENWTDITNTEVCYCVPSTPDGMRAFRAERIGFGYALLPEDQSFVVAFAGDLYVIAGSRNFVTQATGSDPQQALENFLIATAWRSAETAHAKEYYEAIANHYRRFAQ